MSIPSSPEKILWRMQFRSAPGAVFALLATDRGRQKFWCESSEQRGDEILMRFVNGVETTARVLESDLPGLYRLEYFGTEARFELAPDGDGGTLLTMTNTGVDPSEYTEVLAGWLNVLFPLKAAADHGVDLRGHHPERTWENGYADQ